MSISAKHTWLQGIITHNYCTSSSTQFKHPTFGPALTQKSSQGFPRTCCLHNFSVVTSASSHQWHLSLRLILRCFLPFSSCGEGRSSSAEWTAHPVPSSPAPADVPSVRKMLQTQFLSLERLLWTNPCSFTFSQPPMSSARRNSLAFPLKKGTLNTVDNFICGALKHSKQMKKWNEDSGSAGELCSVPEIFVVNLSDLSSKSPSCGE